jgi:hypothetical protein
VVVFAVLTIARLGVLDEMLLQGVPSYGKLIDIYLILLSLFIMNKAQKNLPKEE